MNQVWMIGNIGFLGDLRYVKAKDGSAEFATLSFSLATTDYRANHRETIWHRVKAWHKSAETIAKYCTKGRQIAITGKLVYEEFKDKEGRDKQVAVIRMTSWEFVGPKPKGGGDNGPQASHHEMA